VVIGAGQCGLAISRSLSLASIDHVVLERDDVASSWRTRWDSLRLLTPNWQTRLPGHSYSGPDPHGFMTVPEVIAFLAEYARLVDAPIRTNTNVTSVSSSDNGYLVTTDRGQWRCRAVVLASGAHNVAELPAVASHFPAGVRTLTAKDYRNPDQLDDRGVLVVGASATGLQLADEIQASGRQVTLAVGEHIRMPRTYRGLDIQWWLDALGILDERYDQVDDIVRARRVPSPQLVGSPERITLDLNTLTARGARIVGRLVGAADGKVQFSGSLRNHCAMADIKAARLLSRIDDWAERAEFNIVASEPERLAPTRVPDKPCLRLDLEKSGIGTVLFATGFRADYSWLHVPVLDRKGRLRHDGGVVAAPGLYALGLNFMRRRKSSFMHGVEDEVNDLSAHLVDYVRRSRRPGRLRPAV
jgi:putative flavoprotein involved in K+ transport